MNTDELIDIRRYLQVSQDHFAELLGVSCKSVKRMEDGGKIEKRTALAASRLAEPEARVMLAEADGGYRLVSTSPGQNRILRICRIPDGWFKDLDDAISAAQNFALMNGCIYLSSDVDYSRLADLEHYRSAS